MTDKLKMLLRRTHLFEGESIYSFIIRLAIINGYDSPRTIYNLINNSREGNSYNIFDRSNEGIRILSDISGISENRLLAASVLRFTRVSRQLLKSKDSADSNGSSKELFEKQVKYKLNPFNRAKYCPNCISEKTYHRLEWIPTYVYSCTKHKRLLIDRCPQCKDFISINSVTNGFCKRCGKDLSYGMSNSIDDDSSTLLYQSILKYYLNLSDKPDDIALLRLPSCQTEVLLRTIDGIIQSIKTSQEDWFELFCFNERYDGPKSHQYIDFRDQSWKEKIPSPMGSYLLSFIAFHALSLWPQGFNDFLRAFPHREGKETISGILTRDYGAFYSSWLEKNWHNPEYDFLQQAFNDFLINEYSLTYSVIKTRRYQDHYSTWQITPYIKNEEAARILNISYDCVQRLVESGDLVNVSVNPYSKNNGEYVSRDSILKLRDEWKKTLSLRDTAKYLHVSEDTVRGLVNHGDLQPVSRINGNRFEKWFFPLSRIIKLIEIINENTSNIVYEELPYLSLAQAVRRLSSSGIDSGLLLHLVIIKKIHAMYSVWDNPIPGNAKYFLNDIIQLPRDVIRENGYIQRREISKQLGVKESVFNRWVNNNLIRPIKIINKVQYFTETDTAKFLDNYIFSEKAADILGVEKLVVQKWARNGRLKPVSGSKIDGGHRYLFHKKDVERLAPANRLTAPQLAKELGISKSQMSVWIKRGKIRPISGPGIDRSKHFLFLRDCNE
jgi:predicted site-specific integrase-resolvase